MPNDVIRLLKKLLLLGLPFGLWLGVYLVTDPFCVLHSYPDYHGQGLVAIRDYLAGESLLRQYRSRAYNSFILGNSRTLGFRSQDWSQYLPADAVVFSYGSFSDNLFGISHKLDLLDRLGLHIRDALILFDYTSVVGSKDASTTFLRKHPRVSGANPLEYQVSLARTFFCLQTAWSMWQNKAVWLLPSNPPNMHYDPIHGDIILDGQERLLAQNEDAFYAAHKDELAPRPELAWGPVILENEQFRLLDGMKAILDKHHTRYKLVLAPTQQAVRLNPQDVAHLKRIFGADRVYDYTPASDITSNPRNWYEPMHFRPQLGRRILGEVYR